MKSCNSWATITEAWWKGAIPKYSLCNTVLATIESALQLNPQQKWVFSNRIRGLKYSCYGMWKAIAVCKYQWTHSTLPNTFDVFKWSPYCDYEYINAAMKGTVRYSTARVLVHLLMYIIKLDHLFDCTFCIAHLFQSQSFFHDFQYVFKKK